MSKEQAAENGMKAVFKEIMEKFSKGETLLDCNKKIGNSFLGGAEAVGRLFNDKEVKGVGDAFVKTFAKNGKVERKMVEEGGKMVEKGLKMTEGLDYGKVAGSTLGTLAAGRVASGGGLYKDAKGNANLIGVPFV